MSYNEVSVILVVNPKSRFLDVYFLFRGDLKLGLFSNEKVQAEELARMYSAADLTIAISDAEGFGLSTLESLSCGTPILVTMTGGLQTQVTDGKEWFGIGLEPASKAIIGSQEVPYIYEDRLNREEFLEALTKLYEMSPEDRDKLGQKGRAWSQKHFNFNDYIDRWDKLLTKIHNEKGSWGGPGTEKEGHES